MRQYMHASLHQAGVLVEYNNVVFNLPSSERGRYSVRSIVMILAVNTCYVLSPQKIGCMGTITRLNYGNSRAYLNSMHKPIYY